MPQAEIDYEDLKKRGFLRQRQEGYFVLRTRMSCGKYSRQQLRVLGEISDRYGRGIVHVTTRQGMEVPFIKFEQIVQVEKELADADIRIGASGARLRAITVCPGNNWCKQGSIDTFRLQEKIEKELGIGCGMDLPHKFKIALSGCFNGCTRPQAAEIGVHGAPGGYVVYLGGCAGRAPLAGFKLEKIFSEDEVLELIRKTLKFYKDNAKSRQRLGLLIEEVGRERFLKQIGNTLR